VQVPEVSRSLVLSQIQITCGPRHNQPLILDLVSGRDLAIERYLSGLVGVFSRPSLVRRCNLEEFLPPILSAFTAIVATPNDDKKATGEKKNGGDARHVPAPASSSIVMQETPLLPNQSQALGYTGQGSRNPNPPQA
jgi:hypothetical protein